MNFALLRHTMSERTPPKNVPPILGEFGMFGSKSSNVCLFEPNLQKQKSEFRKF